MDPCNIKTPHSSYIQPSFEQDTIAVGCYNATCFPFWGTLDGFMVESPYAEGIAWGTKDGFDGMEDRDVFNELNSWTSRDGRGSSEGGILLIE